MLPQLGCTVWLSDFFESTFMGDWQPIETAPKDGTKLLGCDSNGNLAVVHWEQNLVRGVHGFQIGVGGLSWPWLQHYFIPKMWQPLPNVPKG